MAADNFAVAADSLVEVADTFELVADTFELVADKLELVADKSELVVDNFAVARCMPRMVQTFELLPLPSLLVSLAMASSIGKCSA